MYVHMPLPFTPVNCIRQGPVRQLFKIVTNQFVIVKRHYGISTREGSKMQQVRAWADNFTVRKSNFRPKRYTNPTAQRGMVGQPLWVTLQMSDDFTLLEAI